MGPTLPLIWIRGNLPLMRNKIQFWNEVNGNHMLNEEDEKVWCIWDEMVIDSKKRYRWAYVFPWWIGVIYLSW